MPGRTRAHVELARRLRLLFWLATMGLQPLASCDDGSSGGLPPGQGVLQILAQAEPGEEADSIAVRPGQARELTFVVLDASSRPVADRAVQFAILEDPSTGEDEARGATLSSDRVVTGADGVATLRLIAGQAGAFTVRASTTRARDLDVIVFVEEGTHGAIEAAPRVEELERSAELTTVRVHLFDGGACAGVRFEKLPNGVRPVRTIPNDGSVRFSSVSTRANHALVGVGLDAAGRLRVGGCVDVPGAALPVEDVVRVPLPLHLLRPAPEGLFRLTSTLNLRPAPKGAAALADAWKELSECPHDPAQLWLDCTVDALTTSAADPLDCRPSESDAPASGPLARRRGVPLPHPRCRDRADGGGRPSLDLLTEMLLPVGAARPPIQAGVPALAGEARLLLDLVRFDSELRISRTTARDQFVVNHRLTRIELPNAATPVVLDAADVLGPVVEARDISGALVGMDLDLDSHGFTLRLGAVARRVFGRASLAPRGAPADPAGFLATLYGLARREERGTILAGCAALDALLATELGGTRGSHLTACNDGLAAMARRLDAAFGALSGDDLDLFLGGGASLIDTNGDRRADLLGRRSANGAEPAAPGVWTGEVRSRFGASSFTGMWTGERIE